MISQPSSGDALKAQVDHLSHGRQHRQSQSGRRSKSSSFTADSSEDVESSSLISSTSPTHSPSHSLPSSPYASHSHLPVPHPSHSHPSTPQTTGLYLLRETGAADLERSDSLDTETADMLDAQEQVDGLSGLQLLEMSSTYNSSDSEKSQEGKESQANSPLLHLHETSGEGSQCSSESEAMGFNSCPSNSRLQRSPSLVTLKPSRSDMDASPPQAPMIGGSPNFLHHWKQTLSLATLWQTLATVAKPQDLAQFCTPTRLINMLIILL